MSYEWGHPVATLPVTNGTIRHIRKMTEILRINLLLTGWDKIALINPCTLLHSLCIDTDWEGVNRTSAKSTKFLPELHHSLHWWACRYLDIYINLIFGIGCTFLFSWTTTST
eukprot:3502623-Pleurochrysis_carterae.AAC.1